MAHTRRPPEILVPFWQQLSSGVYVPSSVSDRVHVAEKINLPRELVQPPAPIALLDRQPSSLDQIVVRPSEQDLGLTQPTTLEHLVEFVSEIPFEPAMIAVCRLQAMNWHIAQNGRAQLGLARDFFGDVALIDRFQAFLDRYPNGVLFSEQEFFVVQRLLVEFAREGNLGEDLTEEEFVSLRTAIIGARAIVDESHENLDRATAGDDEILAYLVQNGAYYQRPNLLTSYARAYSLFIERARVVAREPWACPVEQWMADDWPLTLEEQFAAGFGLQAISKALDEELPAAERSLVDLTKAFAPTALAGRETDIAETVAAPREWFRERFASRGGELRTIAWNNTPFLQRPFIQFADGRLGLISPRTIAVWLGDGFYYRLLECAQRRAPLQQNIVERYTSHVGKLVEGWALDLVRSVFGDDRPPGGGRVHGEQPYGKGQFTPDVAIDLGLDLVLIEVRSGFLREETRVSGDPKEFAKDLERFLFRKMRQLGARIADLIAGSAHIPDIDMRVVERIWPIIVTANITHTEALHDWIERELTAPFRDARVQELVVLDPEELELLMGMAEQSSEGLTEMLARRQESPYARLELIRWVNDDSASPAAARPSYAEERWNRVSRSLDSVLQLPKQSP